MGSMRGGGAKRVSMLYGFRRFGLTAFLFWNAADDVLKDKPLVASDENSIPFHVSYSAWIVTGVRGFCSNSGRHSWTQPRGEVERLADDGA